MSTAEAVLATFGILGGLSGLAAFTDVILRRRKTKAEEEKLKVETKKLGIDGDVTIAGTALEMYKLARAEAQDAKVQAMYCAAKVDALEEHTRVLRSVMRHHKLEPPPFQFPNFVIWKEGQTA